MRYAGFWPRFGSLLVDALVVLVPSFPLLLWILTSTSRLTALFIQLSLVLAFPIYNIYFVGRWGQTLGKMALRIRVVRLNGSPAGYTRALYRHSLDLAFAIATVAVTIFAFMSLTDGDFAGLTHNERTKIVEIKAGAWDSVLNLASTSWIASELLVLLLNERRRALHDYIAGTVVVHTTEVPVAV